MWDDVCGGDVDVRAGCGRVGFDVGVWVGCWWWVMLVGGGGCG